MSDNRTFHDVRNLKPSKDAYDLIKESEGLRLKSYICAAGKPTIGYGRVIPDLNSPRDCTEEQADRWLIEDTSVAASAVRRLVKVPVTQGMFDALVSFTYNLGSGRLQNSTLLRLLNSKDYEGAEAQFDLWVGRPNNNGNPLKGLVIRRDKEENLFDKK